MPRITPPPVRARAHYPDHLVPLVDDPAFWTGALIALGTAVFVIVGLLVAMAVL